MTDQYDSPTTKSPAMTKAEAEQLLSKTVKDLAYAMGHGGANVNVGVQDSRFTRLINWVWASLGAGALALGAWGVLTITELNTKVGILIAQREDELQARKELRDEIRTSQAEIRELRGRVAIVEAKK